MSTIIIQDHRLDTFRNKNSDFDILQSNLIDQTALSKLNWQGLDQPTILGLLKTHQRLLRLYPDPKVVMALLGASPSLDSALAIAAIPEMQFVKDVGPKIGGEAIAQEIHQKATAISAKTMLLWANVHNAVASPHFRAMRVNNVGDDIIHQIEELPNYQELFGSLNFCGCDECCSIFGPAAYFVDLMRIIEQYITLPNKDIAPNLKLDERRPDLATIPLTCENTNDLVPYLDIVNNILATKVAHELDVLPTNATSQQLEDAIDGAYKSLASATYPFNLPFNLPLEQIRSYLGQLNTNLATLYKTFNVAPEFVAREALGLSPEEYSLIITPKPNADDLTKVYGVTVSANDLGGLNNQDMFLKQTGLSRQELQDLLTQNLSASELATASIAHTLYINQVLASGQSLQLAIDGSNTITNLNLATLDRLQRFIRLAKKLNWSFADLDWVLHSLQVSEITSDTIQSIAKIKQVQVKLNLPLDVLCSFWHDIKTIGVGDAKSSQALFDIVFNNPRIVGRQVPYYPSYHDNPLYTGSVLKTPDASSRIAAGLRVSLDDFTALVTAFWDNKQIDLTVQNISILYRHAQLAALVKLPIDQYLLLLSLTNKKQPVFAVDHLDDLLYLLDIVDWLRDSGFTVYELDYILNGHESRYAGKKYKDENIQPFLESLRALDISAQPELQVSDIVNWSGLTTKLRNPSPSTRIRDMQLDVYQIAKDIFASLTSTVQALNTIMTRPDFYQASDFAAITLSGEDLQALKRFNRLLLEAAFPQVINQSNSEQLDLQVSDIANWRSLVIRLNNAGQPGPAHRLWSLFLPDVQQVITQAAKDMSKLTEEQRVAIIQALNTIMTRPDFYQASDFAAITLSGEELQALKRFNRLLLEAAFPQQIKTSSDGQLTLQVSDIMNWPGLFATLNNAGQPGPAHRLWTLFPADLQHVITQAAKDITTLIQALNDILKRPDFYQETDFAAELPEEELQALKRFNRLLLEVAFPQQIKASGDGQLALQTSDITDWSSFVNKLRNPGTSTRIRDLQPDVYQIAQYWLASSVGPTDEEKVAIIQALNSIMARPDFYQETDFAATKLTEEELQARQEFNCLLLEAAFPQQIKASGDGQLALQVSDITDWPDLLAMLNNPSQPGPAHRLWNLFPADVQQVITQAAKDMSKLTEEQKVIIIQALNDILKRPDFYQETDFASVTLSEKAQQALQRFNCLLLEAAFPFLPQIKASSDGRLAFQVSDVRNSDWTELVSILRNPSPSTRIRDLQPNVYQIAKDVLISGTGPTDEQKSKLVEALNSIMAHPDFYQETDFAAVSLVKAQQVMQEFNRLLLEAVFPQEIKASSAGQLALQVSDITDWPSFVNKLRNPGASTRIRDLQPDVYQIAQNVPMLASLTSLTDKQRSMIVQEEQESIVQALNTIMERSDFYQEVDFLPLAPEQVRNLLQSEEILSKNEIQKLNRLLLEAAYPEEIAKGTIRQIDDEWKEKLIQHLATFVGSTTDTVEAIMEWIAKRLTLTLSAGVPGYTDIFLSNSQDDHTYIEQVLDGLSRALVLVEKLQLTGVEIDSVRTHPACYGFLEDFQQVTIDNLKSLSTFKQLTKAFQDTQNQLIGYFSNSSASTADLAAITGWKEEQMKDLAAHFQGMPSLLTSVKGIAQLKEAYDLNMEIGANGSFYDQILFLANNDVEAAWSTYTSAASASTNMVKAKYNDDDWAKVSEKIIGTLNESRRTALTGFVLWKLGQNDNNIKNLRNLSEYLLIDVEMTSCSSISIIKQALLSLQMYLQRCRMNLESGVTTVNIPEVWWEWMMNYRIWEANRKVFLYPENYIDPSLRKSKSDLFQELESELLQSDITLESVEAAYKNYFDKFAELANLQIAASYHCFVKQPNDQDAVDTLFIFGRTVTEPAIYYYRECRYPTAQPPTWTPWSKIDINIQSDYISPVFAFNKLFVFWVEIKETTDSTTNNGSTTKTTVQKATIKYTFQTASKKWMQPQTLVKDKVISVAPDQYHPSGIDLNTEDLIWKKVYPLAMPEAEPEKILIMFGDIPSLPIETPTLPGPSTDKVQSQFDNQIYKALQQGYRASQNPLQGYFSLVPATTLTSDLLTEDRFSILSQEGLEMITVKDKLSQARSDLAATTVENLAIFAGGFADDSDTSSNVVDIYDASTGKWIVTDHDKDKLFQPRYGLAATTVENLAIFAGGFADDSDTSSNVVDIYDANTGKWIVTDHDKDKLFQPRYGLAATTVGNLAIFAGGFVHDGKVTKISDVVDIYDASTGKWIVTDHDKDKLFQPRYLLAATTVGNLAIFAGGFAYDGKVTKISNVVDIYDASTGKWIVTDHDKDKLFQPRYGLVATTVGNLAIFAGGMADDGKVSNVVDIYDASTGKWIVTDHDKDKLFQPRNLLVATTVGNLAIFAGGDAGDGKVSKVSNVVDIYDASTGKWIVTDHDKDKLFQPRNLLAATTVGNLAIFAGGFVDDGKVSKASDVVDIYKGPPVGAVGVIDGTTFKVKTVDNVLLANSYADISRPCGYWPLDEGSGTTIHDQAGSNDGTLQGTANWQSVTDFPGVALRWVLQFDGTSNYIEVPPSTTLDTPNALTIQAWVCSMKSEQTDVDSPIVSKSAHDESNQDGDWELFYGWHLDVAFFTFAGQINKGNSNVTFPDERDLKQWHHIAGVWDGSQVYLYIDGKLKASQPATKQNLSTNTQPLWIGTAVRQQHKDKGAYFNGRIADIRIWDVALRPEQIHLLASRSNSLMEKISRNSSRALTVNNQPGWFIFDNSDEAFLVISQQYGLQPINDGLAIHDNEQDTLELSYHDVSSLTGLKFAFIRLTTSTIRQLSQKVFIGGIDHLLTLESQSTPELDFTRFNPSGSVIAPTSKALDFHGPYGLYFQEIFFHIPFLVANTLAANQRFAEAQKWYHYIFNPTERSSDDSGCHHSDRFWRYLPFRGNTLQKLEEILQDDQAIRIYNDDPFDPHAIAQVRIGAYQKAIVMKYIDNLLNWGDSLFAQDTWESITQATMLYLLAYDLLGPRPENLGQCPPPAPETFRDINAQYNGNIPQFLLDLELHVGGSQSSTLTNMPFNALPAYFCVSENDQFTAYWDRVEDRLYKIRHCQNIAGVVRPLALFEPPINPADLVRAAAGNVPISVAAGLTAQVPHYRFDHLLERAKNMTSTLIQLGSALLSALEKKDAEHLSLLRATQESALLRLIQTTKQKQIDEANANLDSLNKSLAAANNRVGHYNDLLNSGLSAHETDSQNLTISSLTFETLATVYNAIASPAYGQPTIFGLADGGFSWGGIFAASADASGHSSNTLNIGSSLAATMAGYERRREDWQLQLQMAQDDVDLITQQIVASQVNVDIATSELTTHLKSLEQAAEVEDFLKRKFSNYDLYQWMVSRLSVLYFQIFKLALDMALAAQKAYQYELNQDDTYIGFDYWDSLKQGMLAGEGLMLGLNQLEKAYIEGNVRRLEIEKTISLLQLDPNAFLDLKNKGKCQFSLSEKLFDYDFPGHYCRQIKTIALSIPAVIGPYQNIKATLTQQSDQTLIKADVSGVDYLLGSSTLGTVPDPSIVRSCWRHNQKIALSRGVNDSGMFELNFRDERYLPFEGTGAVSKWELSMPKATNRIDFESLSDVIIHLSYTALDAGEGPFTQHVQGTLSPCEGFYYMSLNQAFPSAWSAFLNTKTDQKTQQLKFRIPNEIVPPHLMNAHLESIYFKLDVPEGTDTSGASFMSLQIGNGDPQSIVFVNNRCSFPDINLPADWIMSVDLNADWVMSVDLNNVPEPLKKDGLLNPDIVQNIEVILNYQGEIDWSS